MKSKQDIFDKIVGRHHRELSPQNYTNVEKAMDEYAKHVAISFKEWQDSDLEERKWENYDGHDTWINPQTREVKSTEQLYELYLLQSKQK